MLADVSKVLFCNYQGSLDVTTIHMLQPVIIKRYVLIFCVHEI